MDPLLIDIAEAVRKHHRDDEIVKVVFNDIEYFLLKYGAKVNIQQINPKSSMTEKGWWLLPDNTVYPYDRY